MILFWLICAAFVAVALAFLLPTLLQTDSDGAAGNKEDGGKTEANLDVYRDQLSERLEFVIRRASERLQLLRGKKLIPALNE